MMCFFNGSNRHMAPILLVACCSFFVGCSTTKSTVATGKRAAADQVERYPLGSNENPVRCDQNSGELEYLSRLRCVESGQSPHIRRIGNVGEGPYGTQVSQYLVNCSSKIFEVYLDMHHPGYVEKRPISGFKIVRP